MYHKIRITVVSLVVVVMCMLSSTGTLSYFTDTDVKTNSFTIGIASTTLKVYNNSTLIDDSHLFNDGDYVLENNQNIDFYPRAINDGNIQVYQRFRVVIPIALASVITLNLPPMEGGCTIITTSENTCNNADYTITYKPSVEVNNSPKYAEYYITSNDTVGVGQSTRDWPVLGIHFGDLSSVGGSSAITCENDNNNNCKLGINIYSDVIQTTGFANAVDAFAGLAETYN